MVSVERIKEYQEITEVVDDDDVDEDIYIMVECVFVTIEMVSVERIKEYQEITEVVMKNVEDNSDDEDDAGDDDSNGEDDDEDDDAFKAYMLSPNHSHWPQAPTLHEDTQTQPHFTRSYSYKNTNTR